MDLSGIYLDNAATTFPKPEYVIQAVNTCLYNYAVNPKRGVNPMVRLANEQLDKTRLTVSRHLGCSDEQLVFIPSSTYGLNLVLQGYPLVPGDTIYISPFEHNAVARAVEYLREHKGVNVLQLPMDSCCKLDLEQTRRWFGAKQPKVVTLPHASNVSGDILPIKQVIQLTHEYGGKVLIDAAQTIGLHTPRMDEYDYDFLAFSSHKGVFGIPGSGGLVIKEGAANLRPLVFGGTGSHSGELAMPSSLPERFEAGTFSLPAIISMKAGIEWLEQVGTNKVRSHVANLCEQLLSALELLPGVRIVGRKSEYGNIGIVSLAFDWISPQEVGAILDAEGIAVRGGLHCAPMAHRTFGTLPNGTIRISPSFFNSGRDVSRLVGIIENL